jgi:hypothetical protein
MAAVAGLSVVVPVVVTAGTGGAADAVATSDLTASPSSIDLGSAPLGMIAGPQTFTLTNNGTTTDTISAELSGSGAGSGFNIVGPGADDYGILWDPACAGGTTSIVLAPAASCTMFVFFFPGKLGDRSATLTIQGSADSTPTTVQLDGSGGIGYYQVDQYGDVAYAGDAPYFGGAGTLSLNKPIVAITPTGDNGGYWLVASDGGIFSYGDAGFYGSAGDISLNRPIVGMARTLDGGGYWLVASDGGIFTYGDATFFGSAGNIHLNQPIVGMATTPDGGGYWLVASDGGIFTYGDAAFYGSAGNLRLNAPIVGMAATPDGGGYWLVASDGGVFAYGDAGFYGSAGDVHLNQPIVATAAMPDGAGYWFSAADGGLFNYGSAPFYGSGVGLGLGPVVAMATNGDPTLQSVLDAPFLRHGAHVARAGADRAGLPDLRRMVAPGPESTVPLHLRVK